MEGRFAGYFANWSIRLPEGAVQLEEPGVIQQDGWTIRYVFDNDAEGSYLEFYATHRMTNDRRVRIYSSGETKDLEALETMYGYNPCEVFAAENKRVGRGPSIAHLDARCSESCVVHWEHNPPVEMGGLARSVVVIEYRRVLPERSARVS